MNVKLCGLHVSNQLWVQLVAYGAVMGVSKGIQEAQKVLCTQDDTVRTNIDTL